MTLKGNYVLIPCLFLAIFIFLVNHPSTSSTIVGINTAMVNMYHGDELEPDERDFPTHYRDQTWAGIDCQQIFDGDKNYTKTVAARRKVVRIRKFTEQEMTCDAIKARIFPPRNPDTGFPLLHVRNVFQDYEYLEEQMAVHYAKENFFCYTIDTKSPPILRNKIQRLSDCLPNVFLNNVSVKLDSAGHGQHWAHLGCLRKLVAKPWKYALLMQNHDVLIKSHEEFSDILDIFGGANDVQVLPCPRHLSQGKQTNMGKLKLCPKYLNKTEAYKCHNSSVSWGKGNNQMMLSYEAVKFMLEEIDISPLIKETDKIGYGGDEVVFNTLQITDAMRLPGGIPARCRGDSRDIFRHTLWFQKNCATGYKRHSICIYGIENLPMLAEQKKVMANKFMPDFDYIAICCMAELLWNRTQGIHDHPIDRPFYRNLTAVRFNKERKMANFSADKFKCKL